MSYPARHPDASYPAPPRWVPPEAQRPRRAASQPGTAPPARWPAPPRWPGPPQQGLWPGHPSAPFPTAPAGTVPAGTGPRPGHPSGPLPPVTAPAPSPGRVVGPTRRLDRVVLPGLVPALIGLGAVAVLVLWWRSTPAIGDTGDLLTRAGDALGLLAGYGFVVLVALMARLPPLERGIGTDRLARWHAMGGRYVITLVTGHVVLIVWGYAVTAHEKVTSESVTLLTAYPDVLMATVAWFLLLGVAAFSARAARRRLSYETWYYAHLYTYLAIALAFSHQFANGPAFASDTAARVVWSAMYVLVAAMIVWYRVLTPLRNAARYRFTVQKVRQEGPGIVSVFITGRDFDRLRAEPGQFFRWRFLTRELWWQSHPYSLSAMPQADLMRITVKSRGDHSGSLASLEPGTRVIAEGPYGAFTPALSGRRVLLIAGGVGITPIRAMFAALPRRMSDGITLVYRASHPRDVVFSRELDAIASDRQAALHYLIGSRDRLGYDPLAPGRLQRMVPGVHRYEAYVCGPPGMTETAVESLRALGVPRHRIHRESFDF
ncbi:MAG TPA: ferric reductase-like transmembrane domain-containing protein [Trebonia sp.]|nr:ferric reductase-like transmembrane domain-containing protein [Trebonia sp.]